MEASGWGVLGRGLRGVGPRESGTVHGGGEAVGERASWAGRGWGLWALGVRAHRVGMEVGLWLEQ